jgi:hypothetical protein
LPIQKINLSTWHDFSIIFSGAAHGTALSGDNGIRATLTLVPHWRFTAMSEVNWTLLNYSFFLEVKIKYSFNDLYTSVFNANRNADDFNRHIDHANINTKCYDSSH